MNALVQYAVSDMERMARAFAASKLFGVQNVEQALALCLVAQSEGRHPASAAQDYNIIQGRPAKKADAMLRDFLSAGGKVEWHALTNDKADATFSHPAGGSARIDWDMARAKEAGLGGKDMWKKFPRQMLRSRVVSEGVRTVYPMATSGMYVPEEVQDFAPEPQRLEAPQSDAPALAIEHQSAPKTGPDGRYTAAEGKRQNIFQPMLDLIDCCETLADLLDVEKRFDELTAMHPAKWLDGYWDRIEIRKKELLTPAPEGEADMDAEYRAVVGDFPGDRATSVAGVREAAVA